MRGANLGVVIVVASVALLACSGSSTPPPESNGSGSGGSGGSSGSFALAGTISDAQGNGPLGGAQVCLFGSSSCTMTDASGAFALAGLPSTGSGITASLAGYVTGIWPLTPEADMTNGSWLLRGATRISNVATQAHTTFDGATGALLFEVLNANGSDLAGVSVSTGASGEVVVYVQADGSVDPTLTQTTTWGTGFIFQLPATGDLEVTFHSPNGACTQWNHLGWPAQAGATMSAPIVADQLTLVRAQCP